MALHRLNEPPSSPTCRLRRRGLRTRRCNSPRHDCPSAIGRIPLSRKLCERPTKLPLARSMSKPRRARAAPGVSEVLSAVRVLLERRRAVGGGWWHLRRYGRRCRRRYVSPPGVIAAMAPYFTFCPKSATEMSVSCLDFRYRCGAVAFGRAAHSGGNPSGKGASPWHYSITAAGHPAADDFEGWLLS